MIPIKIRWSSGLIDLNQLGDEFAQLVAASIGGPAGVLSEVMRTYCPKETGNLARSIGVVVGYVPKKNVAYAVVGPRRRSAGRPTRYAHLVEFGHVAVKPIKGTRRRKGNAKDITFVPPKPFVRPAVQSYAGAAGGALAEALDRNLDIKVKAMRGKKITTIEI